MSVTDYVNVAGDDLAVAVRLTHDGQVCTGFVDAWRKRDGTWEAWVKFAVQRDGIAHTRRGWFSYDHIVPVDDNG